ncbi:MAG TPA: hypothetical protein VJJ23_05940 [Candidatus Nanoarchaeia archaeon]|nr:hypothetical protein [Candidatus Nanoarchaeia archaeon]
MKPEKETRILKEAKNMEELVKRATIKFPKSLSSEEFEGLLKYVVKNSSTRISYKKQVTCLMSDAYSHIGGINTSGEVEIAILGNKYEGNIYHYSKSGTTTIPFRSKPAGKGAITMRNTISLDFITTPDYDIEEHKAEVAVWDDIRKLVTQYFTQ